MARNTGGIHSPERAEQIAYFRFLNESVAPKHPEVKWVFAVPNGYKKTVVEQTLSKLEGLKSGVADIVVPIPMVHPTEATMPGEGYAGEEGLFRERSVRYIPGLYIEFKRPSLKPKRAGTPRENVLDENQKEFRTFIISQGYRYRLCFTWQEAARATLVYLGLTKDTELWRVLEINTPKERQAGETGF
jgi:hypothetical protein